ncbi:MAG TPA: undecaprenyl-diphosphate phosphatase [bacterium]|nr:undecaprenyl-diphosphate phosphatase [bacterium]
MMFAQDTGAAILLGVLQGITEFLPISSDGHLALAQSLLGMKDAGLAFILLVHAGTLLSIAIVFRRQVGELARGLFSLPAALGKSPANWSESTRLAGLVILTTLPGAIVGLLFKDAIEKMFSNLVLTGAFFLVSGAVLALTKWARVGNDDVNWKTALMIGLAQAAAVLPGLSRSGCTIGVAILLGVQRARAGEYSFIAAVPIVLGAVLVEVPDIARQSSHGGVLPMVLAFLASFAVGCLALLWLLRVIRHGRFHWFAPYCFLIGIVTLLIAR